MSDERIKGIYGYFDTLKYKIIYIGKDSNIERKARHKEHYYPSSYKDQPINRILQNDKVGRYRYVEFDKGYYDDNSLNEKEIYWIFYFKPLFNFTEGGGGVSGYKHTPESRKKMSDSKKGTHHTDETRQKISENHADFTGEKHPRWKSYARVIKDGFTKSGKQMYTLKYNGKVIKQSINKEKLEKLAEEINSKYQ